MPKLDLADGYESSSGSSAQEDGRVDEITKTQRMLAEVAAAEVDVKYVPTTEEAKCDIFLRLPHDCTIEGHFAYLEDGELYANIGHWRVHEKLLGHGIGRRLLEEFSKLAASRNITHIHACVISREALRAVSSFFGFENLELQGIYAEYTGMSLRQLLALMESGVELGYAIRIKIK